MLRWQRRAWTIVSHKTAPCGIPAGQVALPVKVMSFVADAVVQVAVQLANGGLLWEDGSNRQVIVPEDTPLGTMLVAECTFNYAGVLQEWQQTAACQCVHIRPPNKQFSQQPCMRCAICGCTLSSSSLSNAICTPIGYQGCAGQCAQQCQASVLCRAVAFVRAVDTARSSLSCILYLSEGRACDETVGDTLVAEMMAEPVLQPVSDDVLQLLESRAEAEMSAQIEAFAQDLQKQHVSEAAAAVAKALATLGEWDGEYRSGCRVEPVLPHKCITFLNWYIVAALCQFSSVGADKLSRCPNGHIC